MLEEDFITVSSEQRSDSDNQSESSSLNGVFSKSIVGQVSATSAATVCEKASQTSHSPPRPLESHSASQRIQTLRAFDLKLESPNLIRKDRYNMFLDKALEFTRETPESEWAEPMVIVKQREPLLWNLIHDKIPQVGNLDYSTQLKQMKAVLNCNSEHLQRKWFRILMQQDTRGRGQLPQHYSMYQGVVDKYSIKPLTNREAICCGLGFLVIVGLFMGFVVWLGFLLG